MKGFLFPFWEFKKNENVIIYGAGVVGQDYLHQIIQTGFCSVCCMIDKEYFLCPNLGVEIISPSKIPKRSFDKIIIAIENEFARQIVFKELCDKYNVPKGKIINEPVVKLKSWSIKEKWPMTVSGKKEFSDKKLYLAFCLNGGLGDWIIAKRWIEAILENTTVDYAFDIYSSRHSLQTYLPTLMKNLPVLNFRPLFDDMTDFTRYDVAFNFSYIIYFQQEPHWNDLLRKDKVFYGKVCEIKERAGKYNLCPNGASLSIHYRRCQFNSQNCYTFLHYYGIDISDYHTEIPLVSDYDCTDNLPDEYITLNYGWGNFAAGEITSRNAKIWPLEYFERLVEILHNRFPSIALVQLGVKNTPKMHGIDIFLNNEPLESVKYVLKKSLLHIDNEGGLVHLATQLGTKCAVLFGPTPIHYFGYECNLNILSSKSNCRGCYFLLDNYMKCVRGMKEPECMYSLLPEHVADCVQDYIESVTVK